MAMTLQELEQIRHALRQSLYANRDRAPVEDALVIVRREIDQMKQDQLLSESEANPT